MKVLCGIRAGWRGLLSLLIALLLRLLRRTWRLRVLGGPLRPGQLLAFWHGDQLTLAGARVGSGATLMISRSADGELAAGAARRLGFAAVRGSSHRGAVPAALGLLRSLRRGEAAALAVDGPRGPRHRCGDSALRLAGLAGARVVPVAAAARHQLTLPTWDRMCLPAPFTRVQVVFGEPVEGAGLQQQLEHCATRAVDLLGAPGRRLMAGLLALLLLGGAGCRLEREQARQALGSPQAAVRAEGLRQLGRIGDPALGELVVPHLKDGSARVRRAAVAALGSLGLGSRQRRVLLERLQDADLEVRLSTLRVLGDSGDARLHDPLLEALEDGSPVVRRAASLALRSLGLDGLAQARRRAQQQLALNLRKLGHPDEQVAASAAQLLGSSGRPKALEPLLLRLHGSHRTPLLARALILALGRLGGPRALAELRRLARSGPVPLRAAALSGLGSDDEPLLLQLGGDPAAEVRRAALAALGDRPEPSAAVGVAACRALLDEDQPAARQAARLVQARALRCAELARLLRPLPPGPLRWRVLAELSGSEPTAALIAEASRLAAAYREQAQRWLDAPAWQTLGGSSEPEPAADHSGGPARRPDPGKRAALERLLRRFPERAALDQEDPLLPPSVPGEELLELIGALGGRPQALAFLLELAERPGPMPVRAGALRAALGPAAASATVPASQPAPATGPRLGLLVERALASSQPELQRAAAPGCWLLGSAEAAERLLGSGDFELRAAGARCLAQVQGRRAVARLLALLQEEPHLTLIELLGQLGDGRALEPLLGLLRSLEIGEAEEKLPVVEALGSLADPRAAAALEQELDHPDSRLRVAAARALARAGRPGSLEPLRLCAEDFLAEVREACGDSIRALRR